MIIENKYFVGFNSCNKDLELSNQAVLGMFLDVACIHGITAGENIREVDTRWLLSAYHVKFFSRPKYGEYIIVKTWGRKAFGVSSTREFEIVDMNGQIVCIALSNWAYVNAKEKKLVRIPQYLIENYGYEHEKYNFVEDKVEKLVEPDNLSFVREFNANKDLLDSNMHVNNVKYLAIADTVIPEELYFDKEPNEFKIYYKKQIFDKENVKCYFGKEDNGYVVTLKSNDNTCAILEFIK